ncbi:type II toxin-antitoxin system RelE/ParE family toxin [Rhizobium sp. CECT 9324]|uniref:type II toxin-antitoxin system RelE/ParE family toxin n=1 Tax=Rhizobium sp. CECT 9324 TaxID=2845820 RepID=UPI001E36D1C6|nr:type II toxin-antitoxin system RelE/ParE family toxin [Rhizobium sp. CECT 9324]
MTRRLIFLESAKNDLVGILRYIASESRSISVAQQFVGILRQKCRHLADLPGRVGRPRPELRPDICSFAFRGYVIFLRYTSETLEIVNILEGHRDVASQFDDLPQDKGDN